jgi:hypothetical protein
MDELLPKKGDGPGREAVNLHKRFGAMFAPLSLRQQMAVLDQYQYLIELAASIREIGMTVEQLRKSGALGNGTAVVSWIEAARRVETAAREGGDIDMLAPGERITQSRIQNTRGMDPHFNKACELMECGLQQEAWAVIGTKALIGGDVNAAAALSKMNPPPPTPGGITINNQSFVVQGTLGKKDGEKAVELKEELRRLSQRQGMSLDDAEGVIDAEFTPPKESSP